VQRVLQPFTAHLLAMGSWQNATLRLRTAHWLPDWHALPEARRRQLQRMLTDAPAPYSSWWSPTELCDPNGHLVLATLVDRINTAYAILLALENRGPRAAPAPAGVSGMEVDTDQPGPPAGARSATAAGGEGAACPLLELRRFIGSHVPLVLCMLSLPAPSDLALLYRAYKGGIELSPVQLFMPRDSMAPVEAYAVDIAPALCMQMVEGLTQKRSSNAAPCAASEALKNSLPMACYVREFTKIVRAHMGVLQAAHSGAGPMPNEADLARANNLFALLVQCLRLSVAAGYPRCCFTVDFAVLLRYEHMFSTLRRNGGMRARLAAAFVTYEHLSLNIVREACMAAAQRDGALHAHIAQMFTDYVRYEDDFGAKKADMGRWGLQRSGGDLRLFDKALRDAKLVDPSLNRFAVGRTDKADFVEIMNDAFKDVSVERMADHLMAELLSATPRLDYMLCPWLPEPWIHWLLDYVESRRPGEQYVPAWFEGRAAPPTPAAAAAAPTALGGGGHAMDIAGAGMPAAAVVHGASPLAHLVSPEGQVHLASMFQKMGDTKCKQQIRNLLKRLSPVDYSVLCWFYMMLGRHNERRLKPLDAKYAQAQTLAAQRSAGGQLREHHVRGTLCSLLGCGTLKEYYTPANKPAMRNCNELMMDIHSLALFCCSDTKNTTPLDEFLRPQLTDDQRSTLLGLRTELLEAERSAKHAARKKLTDQCDAVARTGYRIMHKRPCTVRPCTFVPMVGHVFYYSPKKPGVTLCPRCGHHTAWDLANYWRNGFTCAQCDLDERVAAALPRCFCCAAPLYRVDDKRLKFERYMTVGHGATKVESWLCKDAPGLGDVHTYHSALSVYDAHQGCMRSLPICDQCFKPWMLDAARRDHATVQELRWTVQTGLPHTLIRFSR